MTRQERFRATCMDTRMKLQLEFVGLMKRVDAFNEQQRKYGLGAHGNPKVTLRLLRRWAHCWNMATPAQRRWLKNK
jgi:hypothetical protein